MVFPLIAAGISAAASVASAVIGSKPQTTTSRVNYKQMVKDAEAAGFNPLTAIRNGGSAGFTSTTSPGVPLGVGIADAVSGFANVLATYDPHADAKRNLEFKLAEANLQNLQASTGLMQKQINAAPTWTSGTMDRRMGGGSKAGVLTPVRKLETDGSLDRREPETDTPTRVNPYPSWLTKMGWQINPWNVSAQNWEDWVGDNEISSLVFSVGQLGSDLAWNGFRLGAAGVRQAQGPKPLKKLGNYGKPLTLHKSFQ